MMRLPSVEALLAFVSAFVMSVPAHGARTNMLADGTGFETGPDGWDVLSYRVIQDPAAVDTRYGPGWTLVTPADTVWSGSHALALEGSPNLQHHEVRWPSTRLLDGTDYSFSVYVKVDSEVLAGGDCRRAWIVPSFRVSNGDGDAIDPESMRVQSRQLTACWKRIFFQFNTSDIPESKRHPDNSYGFRLTFDATGVDWTDGREYRIYLDDAQLEIGTLPTDYSAPASYDVGVDIIPADAEAPVSERALRQYRLFEEDEPLEFRYWVWAEEGQSRPTNINAKVVDAYARNTLGNAKVLVPNIPLSDPGDGVGTFSVNPADLEGGSGTYRIVLGLPVKRVQEELVFGLLRPFPSRADVSPDLNFFGVQVGNYQYRHRSLNEDGDPTNDTPECEGAERGEPSCTRDVLYALGPDPNLTFWLLDRLGLNHVRLKTLFHPNGIAPNDGIDGEWDLTQVEWFVDTARQYDIEICAILGEAFRKIEVLSNPSVAGYPSWMAVDAYADPDEGWAAFLAGYARLYEELSSALPGKVYAWEVFNEPTANRNSVPVDGLIELNALAHDVFSSSDPGARVVGFGPTGISPQGLRWSEDYPQGRNRLFQDFIEAGGLEEMDAAALHLGVSTEFEQYPDSLYNHSIAMRLTYCGRALYGEMQRLVGAFAPEQAALPFWVTETSYLTGSIFQKYNVPNAYDVDGAGKRVDEYREAARLLTQQFLAILAGGWERGYYFNFEGSVFSGVHNGVFWSLSDVFGSPKPGMVALYEMVRQLAGAEYVTQHRSGSTHRVLYEFSRGEENVLVVYTIDATRPSRPFSKYPMLRKLDMWGNEVTAPVIGPDPVYFIGRGLDVSALAREIDAELARAERRDGARGMAGGDPNLRTLGLPPTSAKAWNGECPAHLWQAYAPNPDDVTGLVHDYRQRFENSADRGFVMAGDFTQLFSDNIPGIDSAIHSGAIALRGSDLLGPNSVLSEKIIAVSGHVEQYVVVSERGGGEVGVFLVANSDPAVNSDPRYQVDVLSPGMADPTDRRVVLEDHVVDLVEVFNENGFVVDPSTEYLVDIVTWAVGDDARFGIDDVTLEVAASAP